MIKTYVPNHKTNVRLSTLLTCSPTACTNGILLSGISLFPVKCVKILGFYHIEMGHMQAFEQDDDLVVGRRGSFARVGDETAPPVIDGERIREATGINLDAAIYDRLQVEAVAICRTIIANDL